MRSFSLKYSSALALARESRSLITPNPGFEEQLRIWEHCKYDIFLPNTAFLSDEGGSMERRKKKAYKAWKSRRDALLGMGEEAVNRARFASMANMAASFGKRRAEEEEKEMKESEGQSEESSACLKGKGWQNLERMEKEWTKKLISGDY
jgi:hypothetical protein